ncbi:phage antirepressor N-terminal domain-containing protein [Serratia quinivorans]|uniref:phage antirepressor N-terminal domain-containing protein n=1 Tax=Serratia quinivorans TaxID=137545 RepID=UPI002179EA7E|nr:phage antirepressor N-terminal domain-containing protein [Serratia quinivorans]CAI1110476.1 Phage anti-repressor protein [Serratia quinivorans]
MNNQLVEVSFRNQSVQAITQDSVVFVAMRPLVENIGIDWAGQQKKLSNQKNKFSCRHISTTGSDGKQYQMLCIPLRKLNGWLFSVNPEKVRPEIKDNLIAYQEECFEVLHDHFTHGEAAPPRRQEEVPAYHTVIADAIENTQNIIDYLKTASRYMEEKIDPAMRAMNCGIFYELHSYVNESRFNARFLHARLSKLQLPIAGKLIK